MHWLFWDIENTGNSKVLSYWKIPHEKTKLIICCSNKVPIPKEIFSNKNPFDHVEFIIFNRQEKDKADNLLVKSLQNHLSDHDITPSDTVHLLSNDRLLNQRFHEEVTESHASLDTSYTSKIWDQLLYDIFIFKSGKTIETCFCKNSEYISKKSLENTFKKSTSKVIRELTKHNMLIPVSKRRWKINVKNNVRNVGSLKEAA